MNAPNNYEAWDALDDIPEDQLFGLNSKIREIKDEDPDVEVVGLTLGVYRTSDGNPRTFHAVAEAQKAMGSTASVHENPEYLQIAGHPQFRQNMLETIFGEESVLLKDENKGRLTTLATPGGTGALYLAGQLLKEVEKETGKKVKLMFGKPTWPNHPNIFEEGSGLEMVGFDHLEGENKAGLESLESTLEANQKTAPGSLPVVLLHGKCHNPTGVDYTSEQIEQLVVLLKKNEAHALIDMAYQGFGDGMEEDTEMIRRMTEGGVPTMFTYSLSKNASLYKQRVGLFGAISSNADTAQRLQKNAERIVRRTWSNPPAYGQEVMNTIFEKNNLKKQWIDEVNRVREELKSRRNQFAELTDGRFPGIENRNGLFSILKLTREQVESLMYLFKDPDFGKKASIVMPYINGFGARINFGATQDDQMELLAKGVNYVYDHK